MIDKFQTFQGLPFFFQNSTRTLSDLGKSKTFQQGSHSFTDKKIQDFSRTAMKNFLAPFRSPRMFKYKEKMAFTYNIQSVVHCRKFSMKQNVI